MAEPLLDVTAGGDFCRRVLDASLNGVYIHDLGQARNTFINAEYTRLTGYTLWQLAALDGAAFYALFHPDDQPRISDHLAGIRTAGDGEVREIEYRFRRADGTWIWCLSRDAVFERAADGSVRTFIGTFLDISARKQVEAALRASEALARRRLEEIELIYDSAPVGLCVLDRELRFVRVNARLAEINGIPVAAHIGRTLREVVPALAAEAEPRMRQVLDTGEPVLDMEIIGETPAQPGVRRTWIESWRPLRDERGQIAGINIVAQEVTAERRDREALAESRERYRLIADFTYDWESWRGSDGTLLWTSPSCERVTGYPPEDFLADPGLLGRITEPQDWPALEQHLCAGLRDPGSQRLRFRIRRADGELRWMEHVCQPVFAADGAFAGRRSSTRDVTERLVAEEALRQREREFATLAEHSPDIIARFDRALRHRYVNAAVERATGRPPAEFIGKTNEELGMPPALCAQWAAVIQAVFASGEPQSLEFAFPAPDGERFYSLRAVPERATDGSVATVLCTTRDETERRSAESRARSLATVVESSADFIGIAGLDGRALYLNRAGQALVGLDGDAAVRATRVEDYLFPEDIPFVRQEVLPQVMRDGRWARDFRLRHFRTGEAIDVHWDIVRIDDPETGQPRQLATVTRDIRREKAAEAALLEANRRKDEFLAVLGHELRNPMAPIRNAVEVLQLRGGEQDAQTRWALALLDRQTAHLSRLLDDLLDISRITRGQLKLEHQPVALREVVQQAVDGVASLMEERRHRLRVALPEAGTQVEGDPVRLAQILLNLLLNAAKYTEAGGAIQLLTEADAHEVRVRVCDNGPGIPPERLEALFAPFAQGQRGEGAAAGGLGLGLTISRRLAELHGGRLTARSDWPRHGSEFTLHLPRLAAAERTARPAAPTTAGGLSVLVVDDNADVAGALAMLLEILGNRVEIAHSGAEALALMARFHPRLALLDIGLPDMDGLDLARRLRERVPDPNRLLLVAVTGYGHDEARERSFAAGFDQHLAKPVDLRTLQGLLEGLQ
jgi:PAS domain S-box-containing protein